MPPSTHPADAVSDTPPDLRGQEESRARLDEFTSLANFHRTEAERMERCARAEAARLTELGAHGLIPELSVDELMKAAAEGSKLAGGPYAEVSVRG